MKNLKFLLKYIRKASFGLSLLLITTVIFISSCEKDETIIIQKNINEENRISFCGIPHPAVSFKGDKPASNDRHSTQDFTRMNYCEASNLTYFIDDCFEEDSPWIAGITSSIEAYNLSPTALFFSPATDAASADVIITCATSGCGKGRFPWTYVSGATLTSDFNTYPSGGTFGNIIQINSDGCTSDCSSYELANGVYQSVIMHEIMHNLGFYHNGYGSSVPGITVNTPDGFTSGSDEGSIINNATNYDSLCNMPSSFNDNDILALQYYYPEFNMIHGDYCENDALEICLNMEVEDIMWEYNGNTSTEDCLTIDPTPTDGYFNVSVSATLGECDLELHKNFPAINTFDNPLEMIHPNYYCDNDPFEICLNIEAEDIIWEYEGSTSTGDCLTIYPEDGFSVSVSATIDDCEFELNKNFPSNGIFTYNNPPPALQNICFGSPICYDFGEGNPDMSNFTVNNNNPLSTLTINTNGTEVCLSTTNKVVQETAQITVQAIGECNSGNVETWNISINNPAICNFNSQTFNELQGDGFIFVIGGLTAPAGPINSGTPSNIGNNPTNTGSGDTNDIINDVVPSYGGNTNSGPSTGGAGLDLSGGIPCTTDSECPIGFECVNGNCKPDF